MQSKRENRKTKEEEQTVRTESKRKIEIWKRVKRMQQRNDLQIIRKATRRKVKSGRNE